MSNQIFLDSSIIVESMKNNIKAIRILEYLLEKDYEIYISPVILEESAYVLKRYNREIKKLIQFLDNNTLVLSIDENTYRLFKEFMLKYSLKTTADLLHLATCKSHNIKLLATLDEDFKDVAEKEGIKLVMDVKDLEKI